MKICPSCKRSFPRLLALSRKDNKTMICDECGMREALASVPAWAIEKDEEKQN